MTNQVTALIIHPDGEADLQKITGDLDTLSGIVGGYIEAFSPMTDEHGAWRGYCNEEGKIEGLPMNIPATMFCAQLGWGGYASGDFLVGSVVLLGMDAAGNEADVPQQVIDAALEATERTEEGKGE